jgi:hypothetical protein
MKRKLERKLDRVAMNQHGLISRPQALALGMSLKQLRLHLKNGQLVRLRRGVYRVRGAPSTWEQTVLAACLATGGVASHQTACRLFGSQVVASNKLALAATHGPKGDGPTGVDLTRAASHKQGETIERWHIPVTSPLRTLTDMAAVIDDATMLELTTDFLGRRVVTADQLRGHVAKDGAGSRRPGARKLREAVRTLLEDGSYDSAAEMRLHHLLTRAAIPEPVRQLVVTSDDGKLIGRLDFAWPEPKVDLEMDGYGSHSTPEAFRQNRVRDMRLTRLGWTVVRTTPAELDGPVGADELLATLGQLLAVATI